MARKKRRKGKNRLKKHLKYELLGLLFIFLAIFGSGASMISDGAIPSSLENIFRFFLGIWYFAASVLLLFTGIVLLVKRRYPNYFSKKLTGFYIGFLGLLLLTHIQTYERLLIDSDVSILKMTLSNFFSFISDKSTSVQLGGGMIGGLLFTISNFLFSQIGAKIVAVFSIMIGSLFLTDFSLGNLFTKIGQQGKQLFFKYKERLQHRLKKNGEVNDNEVEIDTFDQTHADSENEKKQDAPLIEDFSEITYGNEVKQGSQKATKNENDVQNMNEEDEDEDLDILSSQQETIEREDYDYELPPVHLLEEPTISSQQRDKAQIQATVRKLEQTFSSFGVKAKVTKVHVGPAVTKYEINPEAGVKVSRIVNLHDDLALALAAQDIRIEAPIPGKSAIGLELPNKDIATVSLREVLDVSTDSSKLLFALGRDISGDSIVGKLNEMPHLLIAGATGSGKSVCINGIITSILMRAKPNEVKMMMIDPKKVELNVYNGIPHLLTPVVTDPKKASRALQKIVIEMERRYELFSETGTRNIEGYNDYMKRNQTEDDEALHLPYIVVLIDELADLMMVASKEVEDCITRLAQMARAAGIHLIIATQRPSVDVITGVIKANIPSRIAFSVSSQVDSRTILDMGGAEKLLGRGDMLYIPVGRSKPTRVQGAFLSDQEVERVVNHCIGQQQAVYQEEMIPEEIQETTEEVDDELYDDAVGLVIELQTASVSMLQRRFRIGYTRAARLIDAMEDRGIVGPYEGSKPRTVLVASSEEKSS